MPNVPVTKFDTPLAGSGLAAWSSQQRAIAAAHQRKPALDKSDGSVAHIVRLPGAFGNTFGAEQRFGDLAVCAAVEPAVESAQRKHEPLSPLGRQLVQWRSWQPSVQCTPEAMRCIGVCNEIAIKWQFCCISGAEYRRLTQPQPMLDVVHLQDGVPAIEGLAHFTRCEIDWKKPCGIRGGRVV